MAFNVAKHPKELVYFSWVRGHGSYQPFLDKYMYAANLYLPVAKGCDTTGTQKAIDELGFEKMGLTIDPISFGGQKDAMLNTLSLDITGHNMTFPAIKGLIDQLSIYSRETDSKIAQDVVMTLAQVAYLSRFVREGYTTPAKGTGPNYRNRNQRSTKDRRR